MRSFVLVLLLLVIFENVNAACIKSFDEVVEQQLTALDNRDLEVYMSTIPSRDEQLVILPDGSTWETREGIEKGHAEWFKDKSWVFTRQQLSKHVSEHWGIVVYKVSVDRPESPGSPFILSMMFAPEGDGCWYLQHDQNTLLSNKK